LKLIVLKILERHSQLSFLHWEIVKGIKYEKIFDFDCR
jgi:hypothetical protein